jgi:hypothetical protein
VSQSPATALVAPQEAYGEAFGRLAEKIRDGQSFSGRERNVVFLQTGRQDQFLPVAGLLGLDQPDDARGSATVDWDGDGDLDLLVTNRSAPRLRLLRNDQQGLGHW